MKEIALTQDKYTLVDDDDYKELTKWKWHTVLDKNGTFYAARGLRSLGGKRIKILMHRQIMNITDSELMVDHCNHDGLDNRKTNLRISTNSQNQRNRKKKPNTTSNYKGVYWSKAVNKWLVYIQIAPRNRLYLGCFKNENEAALTYNEAAIHYFGQFALINQII